MAIAQRSSSGRARSRYDRLDLYEVVREVAFAAVEQAKERGEKLDPLLLREEDWDEARAGSDYPDAPSARQVCWRLRDQEGKPFSWPELLQLVFDAEADIQQVEVSRTRRPGLDKVTGDAVWYSFRRVAGERPTLTLDGYTEGYAQLIRADRRRSGGGALKDALLTPGQVLQICGSWPDALRRAGLEVHGEHYTAGRVSLEEAALRFTQEVGALPTTKLLRFFARQQGFALEDIDNSRSWATRIREFRAYIVEQGLPEPPEYVPAQTQAAWSRWLEQQAGASANADAGADSDAAEAEEEEASAEDAAAVEAGGIDGDVIPLPTLDAALLDPGRSRRRGSDRERAYQPKRFWPLRSEILEQLKLFLEWELPSAEAKRTTVTYRQWSRLEPGRPSIDSVQKFGPLDQMLREARRPGAIEKAREEEAGAAEQAPAARLERLHRKHVESRKGQELLTLLRKHGEMGRRELEEELRWPQRTTGTYLKWLLEAGAVEKLGPNDRLARYRVAGRMEP